MKIFVFLFLICALLSGCGTQDTFETVADELLLDVDAPMGEMVVALPQEAVMPVSQTETGALYHCDGYELMLQTLPGGNLDATIREVTGFGREDVTLLETGFGDDKRWDLVWTAMGEGGEQVGRAAIVDDGSYHYVLSVQCSAENARKCREDWERLFGSFAIG